MKNIAILFCLVLTWNTQAQQYTNLESTEIETRFLDKSKLPIVKGKLLHYSSTADIELQIEYHLVSLETGKETRYAEIDKDGTFEIKLDVPLPYQQLWLSIGEYYYGEIIANEQLLIEADLKKLKRKSISYFGKGIRFLGKDKDLNIYVNKFNIYKNRDKRRFYDKHHDLILNRQLDASSKAKQHQENYKIWDTILASYIKKNPSPYSSLLLNERDSEYYGWLYTFYIGKELDEKVLKSAFQHQPVMISNSGTSYYSYLASMLKFRSQQEQYKLMQRVLQKEVTDKELISKLDDFLHQYQLKLDKSDTFNSDLFGKQYAFFSEKYQAELQIAKRKSFLQKAQQFGTSRSDILKLVGKPEDKWQRVDYYQMMLSTITTPWVKQLMQKQLDESNEYVASVDRTLAKAATITEASFMGKGIMNLPFGAKLYQSEATDAVALLASIQNAFPNKSLILDVWATWCGPCIYDMTNSTETKAELKKLAVEVVYLCVEDGSSMKKWEKTVAGLKTEGTHIFLDKKLAKSVMAFFDLRGYPSHIFIDQKGNWDTNYIHSLAHLDIENLKLRLAK